MITDNKYEYRMPCPLFSLVVSGLYFGVFLIALPSFISVRITEILIPIGTALIILAGVLWIIEPLRRNMNAIETGFSIFLDMQKMGIEQILFKESSIIEALQDAINRSRDFLRINSFTGYDYYEFRRHLNAVQSWELPQKACSSPKHQALVAYDITGEADKNRWEGSQYFAVPLFPDGGGPRAEGIVCAHTGPDRKSETCSDVDLSFPGIETALTCFLSERFAPVRSK